MTFALRNGRALAWAVPVLAEAAALARSMVFAWAIGADELGRAMMLALAVRLVEMASDVGVDRLIVQAPDGDTQRLQSALQGVAILRGGFAGLVMLALAPALAWMFVDGPHVLTYASLAVIPSLNGFAHLDFRRAERRFEYRPMAVVEGGATIAMLAALAPAIAAWDDHRAMAAVLVAHSAARMVLSYFVAERRYGVLMCGVTLTRSWHFGAPLILNAGLLFLTFYADRLIVAHAYDWATLALYGVVLQLAMLPSQIVGRAARSLVLPTLRSALERGQLGAVWPRIINMHLALAVVMAAGFAALAPFVIDLLYGDDLRPGVWLAFFLAVAAANRILRTPFSQLAVATGRTGDPARANTVRVIAIGLAAGFALAGLPLESVALAAALGEAGATLRAFQLATIARLSGKGVLA